MGTYLLGELQHISISDLLKRKHMPECCSGHAPDESCFPQKETYIRIVKSAILGNLDKNGAG